MSSGRPIRRMPTWTSAMQQLWIHRADHGRIDEAGRDRVDPDPGGDDLLGQGLGHRDDGAFGAVVNRTGYAEDARDRCDVEDGATVAVLHSAQCLPGAQ